MNNRMTRALIEDSDTFEKGLALRKKLLQLLDTWHERGAPSRSGLEEAAHGLLAWKEENGISGLWQIPRVMISATIDDAWGNGIRLINLWAKAMGLDVRYLGVLRPSSIIIETCREIQPDILGMTLLQFDSEDRLLHISKNLPPKTRIIAGGPLFSSDPDLADRTGIHFTAGNAAHFVRLILDHFFP